MDSRRRFLQGAAAAAVVSRTVLGANDRVQMGIIGTGRRGNQVYESFVRNKDVTFIAACEVAKDRLDEFTAKAGVKMDTYTDYRRVLERKDIDAVLIATPDHWHSPMTIAACQAGKDVYVEKPVSNTIEAAVKMLPAARLSKRVVQVGCQQRSWHHFQECAKKVHDGYIGQVNHCVLLFGGGRGRRQLVDAPQQAPAGLDWEMWQGPAPRRPYTQNRQRSWRSYYDYGGGSVSDWGVHLTDATLWFMNADRTAPLLTSASGQYVDMQPPNLDMAPDTFSITWKYDTWVGTFMNAVLPTSDPAMGGMSDLYGNYFYGERGVLLVNRYGYQFWPASPGGTPKGASAVRAERSMDVKGMSEDPDSQFGSATVRHTRNFLDCVKSRQKPACDIETGFNSTLPTLLAVLAIRMGRAFKWDGMKAMPA